MPGDCHESAAECWLLSLLPGGSALSRSNGTIVPITRSKATIDVVIERTRVRRYHGAFGGKATDLDCSIFGVGSGEPDVSVLAARSAALASRSAGPNTPVRISCIN